MNPLDIFLKSDHYFILSWFSTAPDGLRSTLDDFNSSIRRSLEFTGPQSEVAEAAITTEEVLVDTVG